MNLEHLSLEQQNEVLREALEDYQEQIYQIFELFNDVRDEFDGSEYQQGKKDGLRLALAIMQRDPEWVSYDLAHTMNAIQPIDDVARLLRENKSLHAEIRRLNHELGNAQHIAQMATELRKMEIIK